jgi:hypothetical protein
MVSLAVCILWASACSRRPISIPLPPAPERWHTVSASQGHFTYSGSIQGYKQEDWAAASPLPVSIKASSLSPIPLDGWQVQRGVCGLQNRDEPRPVYWFSGTSPLVGLYPGATQQEFFLFPIGSHVAGFRAMSSFGLAPVGDLPAGTYPVESIFFTDRRCTDAGREFGFAHFVWSGQLVFYLSDFTNCEGNLCRVDQEGEEDSNIRPDVITVPIQLDKSLWLGKPLSYEAHILPGTGTRTLHWSVYGPGVNVSGDVLIEGKNPDSFYYGVDLEKGYLDPQPGEPSTYLVAVMQKGTGQPDFVPASGLSVSALQFTQENWK